MADDDKILCPHCLTRLELPAQLYVLREAHRGKGGYVVFGDANQRMPCPRCGKGIRVGDIIDGKHDPKPGGWVEKTAYLVFMGLMLLGLFAMCSNR